VEAPAAGSEVIVTLEAEPGPLYRFAAVSLPGSRAPARIRRRCARPSAWPRASRSTPPRVTTGEAALRVSSAARLCLRRSGRDGHRGRPRDPHRRPHPPVDPNGSRQFGGSGSRDGRCSARTISRRSPAGSRARPTRRRSSRTCGGR
jgi:hypothetical protein